MKPPVCTFRTLAALALGLLLGVQAAFGGWQLVWSDEFNGTNVDTTKWTFDIGNGSGGWGNNELEYYTSRPTNVYVSNGLLHIVARKESYNGFNYTSAKLKTQGLFSTLYGRLEFRVKLPQGVGYWPALWLMPVNSVYGGWAASGEVDIMENKGRYPTNVMGTLHFGGSYPNQSQSSGPSYTFPAGDSVTNFHVYALEWSTNQFNWYVDSTRYEGQSSWWSSGGAYPAPFNIPFYLIMNLAVGGNFDGNPDATTVFPGDMQVDYVRAYTWAVPPAPSLRLRLPLTDPPGTATSPSDSTGSGLAVTLQMTDATGMAADYHGAAGLGVAGANNGSRALDFSVNGTNQPGIPGPLAATTNTALGFGTVTNFVVSLWLKQHALMAAGANIGPRLFVLGGGTPSDSGAADSLGLKFQTAGQLYLQAGSTTVPFSINLQTNNWVFVAAVYDGSSLSVYSGTDGAATSLLTNLMVPLSLNFGSSAALFLGNRQDHQRSFDGWMQDFRFYTGAGDSTFVENIRLLAARPPWGLSATATNGQIGLSWGTALGATQYNVKRGTASGGPYATLPQGTGIAATSFTDSTVESGVTYYYVVSAVNPAGEGTLSAEISAAINPPPSPLSIRALAAGLTLTWQSGTLQSATNISGPWGDVAGAAPPSWPVTPSGPQRYFRLR